MTKPSPYTITEVDGGIRRIARQLTELHQACFTSSAPDIEPTEGWWWVAYNDDQPVGFAGLRSASNTPGSAYLNRAGVLEDHRGHRLQLRMIRLREAKARRLGFNRLISDTTDNVSSSNNLILAGFRLFNPQYRWAFPGSLYWEKDIR